MTKKRAIAVFLTIAFFIMSIVPMADSYRSAAAEPDTDGKVVYSEHGDGVSGIVINLGEEKRESKSSKKLYRYGDRDEQFYNSEEFRYGAALDAQMNNYLTGEGEVPEVEMLTDAEISKYEARGYFGLETKVTFDLTSENLKYTGRDRDLLLWTQQVLGRYPNLSIFFTAISFSYSIRGSEEYYSSVSIYSPVVKDEIPEKIERYKRKMAQLEKEALETSMTDEEKLLLVHDKLVIMSEYAPIDVTDDKTDVIYHIPLATVLDGLGVCQSYSAVMSQTITDLGFETVQVKGKNHVWNAVNLNDKWYYIDATWDDPTNTDRDFVNHDYFLFPADERHAMLAETEEMYGSLLSNMGTEYNDFFPKKNNVETQMCYWNDKWYYAKNGSIYEWTPGQTSAAVFPGISRDAARACGVFDGNLYYSGSDGIYQYQDESILIDSVETKSMIVPGATLYYLSGSDIWTPLVLKEEPIVLPTPKVSQKPTVSPTTSPTMRPTAILTTTPTVSPTSSSVATPSPVVSMTPAPTVQVTVSPTPSSVATPGSTVSESPEPTMQVTASPTPSSAVTLSPAVTPDTTVSESPEPTMQVTASPTPSSAVTLSPVVTPDYTVSEPPAPTAQVTMGPAPSPMSTGGSHLTPASITPAGPGSVISPTIPAVTAAGDADAETESEAGLSRPSKPAIKSVKNIKKCKVKLILKKKVKNAAGYQVQYSVKKNFGRASSLTTKKKTVIIKKLKKNKTYYIRVRAYVPDGKEKVYGSWSKRKKVRIRK